MPFPNSDFVHLHVHSEFSRFDGLAKMGDLVMHARKMGFRSMALTDHGNVGGWIRFYNECNKKKDKDGNVILGADGQPLATLKPIFGCEVYVSRDLKYRGIAQQPDGKKGNRHLLLLAKNQEGYENLCTLSQKAWIDGQAFNAPRTDLNEIAKHSKGLICSSACIGSLINSNLLYDRYDQAKRTATLFKDIFGEDFFLEVMYHGIDAEAVIIPLIFKLGRELGIPVICSNDAHYIRKEQARSHEVVMAMNQFKCIKDPKLYKFGYDEFYLKSAEEMGRIFGHRPEIMLNTVALSERVEDFLKTGGMRLPKFDLDQARERVVLAAKKNKPDAPPPELPSENDPYVFMEKLAWQGMKRLGWDNSPKHIEQLKLELGDVKVAFDNNAMDFATYFLIVWDIINFAKNEGIMTGCGRGSGYASILLRALGITFGPDPLKYSLLWQRFLAFDWGYFLLDSDWGFDSKEDSVAVLESPDEIEEERDVEDDLGGVDRY
jgi:DNA polymerase-3 subunit alpha